MAIVNQFPGDGGGSIEKLFYVETIDCTYMRTTNSYSAEEQSLKMVVTDTTLEVAISLVASAEVTGHYYLYIVPTVDILVTIGEATKTLIANTSYMLDYACIGTTRKVYFSDDTSHYDSIEYRKGSSSGFSRNYYYYHKMTFTKA